MSIKYADDIEKIINDIDFVKIKFTDYLEELLNTKSLVKKQVIKDSNISTNYVYQIFNGKRKPQRNKVIMLSFGLKLTTSETFELLKIAEVATLYEKNKRDLIILHCIENRVSIIDCNILLDKANEDILD